MITHPVALNTVVHANRPSCPCKNAKYENVKGTVAKVIRSGSSIWYYLDTGITVNSAWVTHVE